MIKFKKQKTKNKTHRKRFIALQQTTESQVSVVARRLL